MASKYEKMTAFLNEKFKGHNGKPFVYIRDYDWHLYGDYRNSSVAPYRDKLDNPKRITVDDVVLFNVLKAFDKIEYKEEFKKFAQTAVDILEAIIESIDKEKDDE